MSDAVDVLKAKRNENTADDTVDPNLQTHVFNSIEAAIEAWLDDGDTPAEFSRTYTSSMGQNRVAIVIEYDNGGSL